MAKVRYNEFLLPRKAEKIQALARIRTQDFKSARRAHYQLGHTLNLIITVTK